MKKKTKEPKRSAVFQSSRLHRSLVIAEDYTELIADLIALKGEARIRDISHEMGVSHVTALRTVRRLQTEGYLTAEPHTSIVLTKKGQKLAAFSKERHQVLFRFLVTIGVPEDVAQIDAEGIEHFLSAQTCQALQKQLAILEKRDVSNL
jgi:DtxR family manganese transport transcriptional regulator